MRLFDETESKYYQLISSLLLLKRDFTGNDVERLLSQMSYGEKDFQVLENLFSEQQGQEVLFSFKDGKYTPILDNSIPILANSIEREAFQSLSALPYAERFLREDTLRKIKGEKTLEFTETVEPMETAKSTEEAGHTNITEDCYREHLPIEFIEIRNRYRTEFPNSTAHQVQPSDTLMVIAAAIRERRSIIYDNIRDGIYDYKQAEAFPVKIEYSVLQDVFRISAFEPVQNRFFMMTLDTMQQVRLGTKIREDVPFMYEDFLRRNKKTVLLDVEPTGHVIERCFRIFSFYERKAVYDSDADRYSLEITYHSYDEAELIRDILSLGSSVVVIKPAGIRRKVFSRINAAAGLFA